MKRSDIGKEKRKGRKKRRIRREGRNRYVKHDDEMKN